MAIVIRTSVAVVLMQHAEDAAMLANNRALQLTSPHVKLHHLRRLDVRLAAHLDGLTVSGDYGSRQETIQLSTRGRGNAFTATVIAIEDRDVVELEKLLTITEATPESWSAINSAFGWVPSANLFDITNVLRESPNMFRRELSLATCSMHQINPGAALTTALQDKNAPLRSRALKVIANLTLQDHLPACLTALTDEDSDCAYQAARAAVLLGDRGASVAALRRIALAPSPWRSRALRLLLKMQSPSDAHATLKALAQDPACVRLLIQGVGTAGDSH
jgi:uncharacterized protein (TIGR02270 family)